MPTKVKCKCGILEMLFMKMNPQDIKDGDFECDFCFENLKKQKENSVENIPKELGILESLEETEKNIKKKLGRPKKKEEVNQE
jgi:hypothetical protein